MDVLTSTRYKLDDGDTLFVSCYDKIGLQTLAIHGRNFAVEITLQKAEIFLPVFAREIKDMRERVDGRKNET